MNIAPPAFPLTCLARGQRGRVHTIPHDATIERRLLEMGFMEGAVVEVLHEGAIRRDPVAVRVDDRTIALRRSEASSILVEAIG